MHLILLLGLVLPYSCWGFDALVADGQPIVPAWTRQALTFTQALSLISKLDGWYGRLDAGRQAKNYEDYVLHRNRLFLVAQEKRLADEIARKESPWSITRYARAAQGTRWMDAANAARMADAREQLATLKKINDELLERSADLSWQKISQIADLQNRKEFRTQTTLNSSSFSRSLSKSGAPTSDRFDHLYFIGDRRSWPELRPLESAAARSAPGPKDLPTVDDRVVTDWKPSREEAAFLKNLGLEKTSTSHPGCKDLSSSFPKPETQWKEGRANAKCAGHAIAGDIAATLNRKNYFFSRSRASPDQIYGAIRLIEDGQAQPVPNSPDYCNLSAYETSPYTGVASVIGALDALQKHPVCPAATEGLSLPPGKLLRVEGFAALEKPDISAELVKEMIDQGLPPIVRINSDARDESGEWIEIKKGGRLSHVINVTGYCEDIDSRDLRKKTFFIVRDSLGTREMHYKISAENLHQHISGIYKIKNVVSAN